jgi:hypothetical protein
VYRIGLQSKWSCISAGVGYLMSYGPYQIMESSIVHLDVDETEPLHLMQNGDEPQLDVPDL